MNAVIYARFSSYSQTEQSIEGQLRVCKEYADKNNINIINEYIDRAISGTSDQRPAFLQMIEDSSKKEFSQILVYKLDRFSRNKYDSVVYKHKLSQYGVRVISATETISDSPEGALMEGLLEMFAEMYSKELSQKVKRGIKESLLKGNFIGGHLLYGYKVVDKKIIINEDEAKIIRYYFENYALGKSKKQIINELNSKGFRKPDGKPFKITALAHALKNKKYTGKYEINGMVIENCYPQIIDEELFEKVQKMLSKHKKAPATTKANKEFLLTGKAFCGYCGQNIVGVSGTSKTGNTHYYYACSKKYKTHSCKKKYDQKDFLEDIVVNKIKENVLNPNIQDIIVEKIYETLQNNKDTLKLNELENQVKKTDSLLDNCFNLILTATSDEIKIRAENKSKELEILKSDLNNEITKIKLLKSTLKSKTEIKQILQMFVKNNESGLEYKKRIINSFINAVYVYDDKIIIYYNVFDTHQINLLENQEDIQNIDKNGFILDFNPITKSSNFKTIAPPNKT